MQGHLVLQDVLFRLGSMDVSWVYTITVCAILYLLAYVCMCVGLCVGDAVQVGCLALLLLILYTLGRICLQTRSVIVVSNDSVPS